MSAQRWSEADLAQALRRGDATIVGGPSVIGQGPSGPPPPEVRREPLPGSAYYVLSYPPSVNHLYKRGHGGKLVLTEAAAAYRESSCQRLTIAGAQRWPAGVALECWIIWHPPDKRRRDIDNPSKAVFDVLEHGGIVDNDNQIALLHALRADATDGPGCVELWLARLGR